MLLRDVLTLLRAHPAAALHLMLPDGEFVPAHFHVTEVGRVHKDFIDCGGTTRASTHCQWQIWVAADADHRLNAGRLASILKLAAPLLQTDDLPVQIEYEAGTITQYPLGDVEVTPNGLLFNLGTKHTECLAPDQCGVACC